MGDVIGQSIHYLYCDFIHPQAAQSAIHPLQAAKNAALWSLTHDSRVHGASDGTSTSWRAT